MFMTFDMLVIRHCMHYVFTEKKVQRWARRKERSNLIKRIGYIIMPFIWGIRSLWERVGYYCFQSGIIESRFYQSVPLEKRGEELQYDDDLKVAYA